MYLQSKCTDSQTAIIESGPPTNPPIHGDRLISKHWTSTRGMRTGAQNLFCWDFGGRRVFKCLGRWRRPGLGPWSMGGPWAGTKMMIITNRIPMNINITQKFRFLLALKKCHWSPWPWLPHPLILRPRHITIIKITDIIPITRQKPAYGRQGLAAVSLRASGAQLGRGKWSFFVTHKHCIIIYISSS